LNAVTVTVGRRTYHQEVLVSFYTRRDYVTLTAAAEQLLSYTVNSRARSMRSCNKPYIMAWNCLLSTNGSVAAGQKGNCPP